MYYLQQPRATSAEVPSIHHKEASSVQGGHPYVGRCNSWHVALCLVINTPSTMTMRLTWSIQMLQPNQHSIPCHIVMGSQHMCRSSCSPIPHSTGWIQMCRVLSPILYVPGQFLLTRLCTQPLPTTETSTCDTSPHTLPFG